MTRPTDDRSSMAQALAWTSRITTISLEMVVPGVIGYWIDQQLGTIMVFLILGVVLGMTTGVMHLVRLAQESQSDGSEDQGGDDEPGPANDDGRHEKR